VSKRKETVDIYGRTHVLEMDGSSVGKDFYVTVIDGPRAGFLLGPFKTHKEALDNVERGRRLANKVNDRACWYGYGTASAPHGAEIPTVFKLDEQP
jgi:hypothetical protein